MQILKFANTESVLAILYNIFTMKKKFAQEENKNFRFQIGAPLFHLENSAISLSNYALSPYLSKPEVLNDSTGNRNIINNSKVKFNS